MKQPRDKNIINTGCLVYKTASFQATMRKYSLVNIDLFFTRKFPISLDQVIKKISKAEVELSLSKLYSFLLLEF